MSYFTDSVGYKLILTYEGLYVTNKRTFLKKPISDLKGHPPGSANTFEGCTFNNNGIGIHNEACVPMNMKNTHFNNNGIGIVNGTTEQRFLDTLIRDGADQRFQYCQDLNKIKEETDEEVKYNLIKESSISKRLSSFASIATISTWLKNIIDGTGDLKWNEVLKALMGG